MATTFTVEVPFEEAFPDGAEEEHTIMIQMRGRGSFNRQAGEVAELLTRGFGITLAAMLSLWRQEDPTVWYVKLPPALYQGMHGKTATIEGTTITLEHLDKRRQKIFINWVPPSFSRDSLQKIANQMAEDGTTPELVKLKRDDRWLVLINPKVEAKHLHHFINVRLTGSLQNLTFLIQVPGRRTACRTCGLAHNPGGCPRKQPEPTPNETQRNPHDKTPQTDETTEQQTPQREGKRRRKDSEGFIMPKKTARPPKPPRATPPPTDETLPTTSPSTPTTTSLTTKTTKATARTLEKKITDNKTPRERSTSPAAVGVTISLAKEHTGYTSDDDDEEEIQRYMKLLETPKLQFNDRRESPTKHTHKESS